MHSSCHSESNYRILREGLFFNVFYPTGNANAFFLLTVHTVAGISSCRLTGDYSATFSIIIRIYIVKHYAFTGFVNKY